MNSNDLLTTLIDSRLSLPPAMLAVSSDMLIEATNVSAGMKKSHQCTEEDKDPPVFHGIDNIPFISHPSIDLRAKGFLNSIRLYSMYSLFLHLTTK